MQNYLDKLHEQITERNENIELYAEIIKNITKTVNDNNELRLQINKCYNFIQKNLYELRFNSELKEIQDDNMNLLQQKLFFVRGLKHITISEENHFY